MYCSFLKASVQHSISKRLDELAVVCAPIVDEEINSAIKRKGKPIVQSQQWGREENVKAVKKSQGLQLTIISVVD